MCYAPRVWEVIWTDEWREWFDGLSDEQQGAVLAALDVLRLKGPALGRPLVDRVKGSQFHNMKELRVSQDGDLRSLFAFDAARQAFLLVGGNKTGQWNRWYGVNIPKADELFARHQEELAVEGGEE